MQILNFKIMKFSKLITSLLLIFCFSFFVSCSNDEGTDEVEDVIAGENDDDPTADDDSENENENEGEEEDNNDQDNTDNDTVDVSNRFIFDSGLVIENSYNTGGCDSPPCDTEDESLDGVFDNSVPDDPYFYLATDGSELNLECQLEKGRRTEFKQITRGPLTSLSKIEFEGVYYDIPDNGVTIAQVHNRGGNSNKPFFRLVLYKNGLETVIRKDPEVSSSDTSFSKEDFSFIGNEDYDLSSLKVVLEKSGGLVHISVAQNDIILLDESYGADATTDWVNDSGIANGFYLKAGLYNDDGPHTKNLVVGYSTFVYESND